MQEHRGNFLIEGHGLREEVVLQLLHCGVDFEEQDSRSHRLIRRVTRRSIEMAWYPKVVTRMAYATRGNLHGGAEVPDVGRTAPLNHQYKAIVSLNRLRFDMFLQLYCQGNGQHFVGSQVHLCWVERGIAPKIGPSAACRSHLGQMCSRGGMTSAARQCISHGKGIWWGER